MKRQFETWRERNPEKNKALHELYYRSLKVRRKKCASCKRIVIVFKNGKCTQCNTSYKKKWVKANPEKNQRQHRRYYLKNKNKHQAAVKRYRKEHYEESLYAQRKWYYSHKDISRKASRRRMLRINYDMSEEDYENLYREQNGVCAVCKQPSLDGKLLAVDHNHKTGKIRGLLCSKHNRALGSFNDDIELLKEAINYLEKYVEKNI